MVSPGLLICTYRRVHVPCAVPVNHLPIPPVYALMTASNYGDSHLSSMHLNARKGRYEKPVFPMRSFNIFCSYIRKGNAI